MTSKEKEPNKIKRIVLDILLDKNLEKGRSENDAKILFSHYELLEEHFVNEANCNMYIVNSDIHDYDFCSFSMEFIKLNSTLIIGVYIEAFHNYTQYYICLYEKTPEEKFKYKIGRCYDDTHRNVLNEFIKDYNILL